MNKKRYSFYERLAIETMLNEESTIKEIEIEIKRPSCNIIKEIKKHSVYFFPNSFNNYNCCLKRDTCKVKSYECYKTCKNVSFNLCPKLAKSPHVCNGCTSKSGCRYVKVYYKAREANDDYNNTLSECRKGLHYTEQEIIILNERLCPLIKQTKSIYHAVSTVNRILNQDFNVKTIYWQINKGYLNITKSDLPRKRKNKQVEVDKNYKRDIKGHTYDDYEVDKLENPTAIETQMDTVEGIKENDAPVFLTLEIVDINFLFIFKINSQTKKEVINKLMSFKDTISEDTFNKIMRILLTDNGKEFFILEDLLESCPNVHLYYCHPYSSYEKGSIENSHELIRRVIPKGVSLKCYTQNDINKLCSHINSLLRENLNGKCPFDLVDKYISLETLKKLGLEKINPLDVCLTPELLGDKNIDNIKRYLDKKQIEEANIKLVEK